MTPASWQPDPTGRNQFRWWDGAAWTDHVSNNGQTGDDPLQPVAAPVAPTVPVAPVATPPVATPPVPPTVVQPVQPGPAFATAPAGEAPKSGPTWWKIALPILAVLAVGVVLFVVIGGGDDEAKNPFGVTETEQTTADQPIVLDFSLERGDVIRVRVEAEDGQPRAVLVTDDATTKAYTDSILALFSDSEFSDFVTDPEDLFTDVDDLLSDTDLGELGSEKRNPALLDIGQFDDGEAVADFLPILATGTYRLVVASNDGQELGKTRIIVEKRDQQLSEKVLTDFSEIDSFFSDGDDEFFSDDAFYSETDAFEPK